MKVFICSLITLLLTACVGDTSKPNTTTESPSTNPTNQTTGEQGGASEQDDLNNVDDDVDDVDDVDDHRGNTLIFNQGKLGQATLG